MEALDKQNLLEYKRYAMDQNIMEMITLAFQIQIGAPGAQCHFRAKDARFDSWLSH